MLIVLNDHGGDRMDVTDDVTTTLRAESHHPPIVLQPSAVMVSYAVHENQRGDIHIDQDLSYQLTTGGGKPGQGYPCVLQLLTECRQLKENE